MKMSKSIVDLLVSCVWCVWCRRFLYDQKHSEELSTRLRQREAELTEATTLIADTRSELASLRNRTEGYEEVRNNQVTL